MSASGAKKIVNSPSVSDIPGILCTSNTATSTTNNFAHKDAARWSPKDVTDFLAAKADEFVLKDEHIKTLEDNEVPGHVFMKLTRKDLSSDPFNLKYGPARTIEELIKSLNQTCTEFSLPQYNVLCEFLQAVLLTVTVKASTSQFKQPVKTAFPGGLDYLSPRDLLGTTGSNWTYQPGKNLYSVLRSKLKETWRHFNERPEGALADKLYYPVYLFLAGVGCGKSRNANEFYNSLIQCLEEDDKELRERLKNAWVFHVTLENGAGLRSEEVENPFKAIGTRMLWQLLPDKALGNVINEFMAPDPVDVLQLLARNHQRTLKESTVILVVDGIQNISETLHFGLTVTSIGDLSGAGPFVIPCITATSSIEIQKAFGDSTRPRIFLPVEPLLSPFVDNAPVFNEDPLTALLLSDCGGHGRALEILADILAVTDISTVDLSDLLARIRDQLSELYQGFIKWSDNEVRALIIAVLVRQRLNRNSVLPGTQQTPEQFARSGLIRFITEPNQADGYLDAPYVWMWLLATSYPSEMNRLWRFDDHNKAKEIFDKTIQLYPITWEEFEGFNARFRCIKSLALEEGVATNTSEIHGGADLKGGIKFTNHHLTPECAMRQIMTKPTWKGDVECQNTTVGSHDTSYFITNAKSASSGDSFCRLDAPWVPNEVHQYKFYTRKSLTQKMFKEERAKAASPGDFFILLTTAKSPFSSGDELPNNSGLVHAGNWKSYFGPFAGRLFLGVEPPYINNVSKPFLQLVAKADAEKILQKRPFVDIKDALERTSIDERILKRFKW